MLEISFEIICKMLKKISLPDCQLVVGIANGGVVPASLVACLLNRDLRIIRSQYRDENNNPCFPEPVIKNTVTVTPDISTILLVDDVSISGKTLSAAREVFKEYTVKTFVFRGKADFVLFPELDECVSWPWRV
ncbi:MAG: phosphoribosyltransferase family protein [Candidatus Omnitrophota bacterium]|jgi:hypoxanthine phosphoribosyltransferase